MRQKKNDTIGTSDPQKLSTSKQESSAPLYESKVIAGLHVVATPIGHAQDITLRALQTLKACDRILCEDTRTSRKILQIHGITDKKLMAYHEHNAQKMRPKVLGFLEAGETICLISDAGTPLINDPGYKLVQEVAEKGLPYTAAPGACSPINALVLSGLPSDRFFYCGFLPAKSGKRRQDLERLKPIEATLVFLESPHRLSECLTDMAHVFNDRKASVVREMTKKFEEVRTDSLNELRDHYETHPARGEIVIVVAPPEQTKEETSPEDLDHLLSEALKRLSLKDAVSEVVSITGLKKRDVYNRAVELKSDP